MPLKIGFIGAGNITTGHMKNARELGLDLVAVADVNEAAGQSRADEYGMNAYTDHGQMLAAGGLDIVVVGTPNKFHLAQASDCLDAGCNVLLEKPMALSADEADQIIAARDKSGKQLMMGMPQRFRGSSQTLKHFIDAGRCGQLYAGQSFWWRRRGIPGFGGWFTRKDMSGGGALIDIGVHMLDLALYLWGFPKIASVSGCTYNTWNKLSGYTYTSMWGTPVGEDKDVDDLAFALIRFADGGHLQLNVSWAVNRPELSPPMGVFLQGTEGGVGLEGLDTPKFYGEEEGHIVDVAPEFVKAGGLKEELAHFIDVIENNAELTSTAEQGRTVMSILDAIYRSSEQQSEVALQ